MGSSATTRPLVSPEFAAAFQAAVGPEGVMPFSDFMELALYHPTVGYYRRPRARIGLGAGTDFFTATHTGTLFGELLSAACVQLLGRREPRQYTFVEIGAEPGRSVLAGVDHPFAEVRTLRLGDPLAIAGDCVVFSNELFDAQPCVRTVYSAGGWQEICVRLDGGRLVEVTRAAAYPDPGCEGYHFDRPLAAAHLAGEIAAQPWDGLFVAFDYGRSLVDLTEHTPAGTLRAYHRHTQTRDVLAHPGEQDLTCDICWDWMVEALRRHRFSEPTVEFQEAFLVRHAGAALAAISAAEAGRVSRRKLALQQLLHPSQMGHKFQVLCALRSSTSR